MTTNTIVKEALRAGAVASPLAREMLAELADSRHDDGIQAMIERASDFPSPLVALLAGIGVHPECRRQADAMMSAAWSAPWTPREPALNEVVIGSGPHALIYAAIRSAKGVKVTVIERLGRAGGSFACSQGDAFWLNSRNRPGDLSLPGEGLGLNVLPGGLLQPAMVGGGEYQTNADLAWVVRMNLMMLPNVEVHTGVEVTRIEYRRVSGRARYELTVPGAGTQVVSARRVVFATGLGDAKQFNNAPRSERQISFYEFMSRMDKQFPMRGMRRVAVIGAGDSGKTAVETLLGQGPTTGMSVAGLDFVDRIDWYGAPWSNQKAFCDVNRGRYNRIGKALGGRLQAQARLDYYPTPGYQSMQIGSKSYDWVIDCTGFKKVPPVIGFSQPDAPEFQVAGRSVGRRAYLNNREDEVYEVGPAANLPLPQGDRALSPGLVGVPENVTSMFRYAPLTAALADNLKVL